MCELEFGCTQLSDAAIFGMVITHPRHDSRPIRGCTQNMLRFKGVKFVEFSLEFDVWKAIK